MATACSKACAATAARCSGLREHIVRLYESAKAIWLEIPMSQDAMCDAVNEAVRVNKIDDGYIRLVVTRGAGTLGLDPNRCSNPQVIIIADAISLYPQELYEKGLEIVTVSVHAQPSGRAQPADQVAQLPQQHPGQDRRPAGRLHRSADAQPQGRSGRVHGRQHLPGAQRRAATRRRSTPASWKASRATR